MSSEDGAKIVRAAAGGKARAERLSTDQRKEIARQAASARWHADLPKAVDSGVLDLAGRRIQCAVLETKKRVLTQETFLTAIGRAGKAKGGKGGESYEPGLPPFLAAENLEPFISDELWEALTPVPFRTERGIRAIGFDARLLPLVCSVYMNARRAGDLLGSQRHIADRCEELVMSIAEHGIIAMVDVATGYAERCAHEEIRKLVEAYVQPELRPWTKTFEDDFFREIFRLHGWPYRAGDTGRPPYVGRFINRYVYEQLPPGVLAELQRLNPTQENGRRRKLHWQHLTDEPGIVHLRKLLDGVTMLMRMSDDKEEFDHLHGKAYPKGGQMRLPIGLAQPALPSGGRAGRR